MTDPPAVTPPIVTPPTGTDPAERKSLLGGDLPSADAKAPVVPPIVDPAAKPADKPADVVLKLPEKSPLAESDVKVVTELAKAKGLTQDQAQAVLDLRAADVAARATESQKAVKDAHAKAFVDAEAAFKADKEFGGEKAAESLRAAKRAIGAFADPELVKFLDAHPLGSDPLVIRAFARIGRAMGEDTPAGSQAGTPATPAPASIASRWYPSATA